MSKHEASHQHHQSAAQKQQKSDKQTQLFSRIMLTVLILAGMSPSIYFMMRGMVIWGLGLIIVGIIILIFVWKPHKGESK